MINYQLFNCSWISCINRLFVFIYIATSFIIKNSYAMFRTPITDGWVSRYTLRWQKVGTHSLHNRIKKKDRNWNLFPAKCRQNVDVKCVRKSYILISSRLILKFDWIKKWVYVEKGVVSSLSKQSGNSIPYYLLTILWASTKGCTVSPYNWL